ncbi:MAG: TonB-dependent receptor [Acidobacteria bacterium]|nr:TonB-dependent receptor [Acidobacteriota bacterium]
MRFLAIFLAVLLALPAAEYKGIVLFGSLPVPGASVTATKAGTTAGTITDAAGAYSLDLPDGPWTIKVDMQLFKTQERQFTSNAEPAKWELEMAPQEKKEVVTAAPSVPVQNPKKPQPAATNTKSAFQKAEVAAKESAPAAPAAPQQVDPELAQRAADGLLINGSVNNGALTPFAQLPAFGNYRRGQRSMYNTSLGLILNNSAFDARSYSVTGQDTPKPGYSRAQGLFSFGGPIKIPRLLPRNGPMLTVNYQWTRNTNASTQSGLVPTAAERTGDFSNALRAPIDPTNGLPFANALIPQSRISAQARSLLALFPSPNFTGSSRYNFQTPIVSGMHQDDLQTRVNKQKRKNYFSGNFNWESTRTSNPNLYGFLDTGRTMGINTGFNYRRSIHPRFFVNLGLQYSRQNDRLTPFFANRRNVSGEAGIGGNNQDPVNWGPPSLSFASGISPLSDAQASFTRNQTMAYSADAFFNRAGHNVTFGGVHRRQQFNLLAQQDARGSLVFTGAAAGNDTAGFLLGIPDTSAIAFGNADKYLRATITESFINDDWRVNPGLTLNYGLRWEYWSPAHEKYGRLVNLDSAARPVIGGELEPDRNNFAPRAGFSWRPFPASSMIVRGGYGIYYDTSVYQPIATQMAQQAPLSKSLRLSNSPSTPLSLANAFPNNAAATSATTFAVDPHFRVGYSQNWQLSIQRDLPAALQITAAYNGGKGTRAQQQFLPNTFPAGAISPSGYTYLVSNGNSIRHAGNIQLRRRLRSGLSAQMSYTFAKSLDNAALGGKNQGGPMIAQNWLDLSAERGRSNFDQRHLMTAMAQYTTGMGLRGGALATGWKAKALKEWTITSQINAGSGLPLNPVYLAAVQGTGFTGNLRPDFTGADLYAAPPGFFLNPAAAAIPAPGRWGNAGRNSISGPSQFSLNSSIGRTFRGTERFSVDMRLDASNALNSVRFPSWNTIVGNAQFGLPTTASPMRTVQLTLRTRF